MDNGLNFSQAYDGFSFLFPFFFFRSLSFFLYGTARPNFLRRAAKQSD